MKKIVDFLKANIKVIILLVIVLVFLVIYISQNSLKNKTTYTVINGDIENSVETNLYVIKDEKVVDFDSSQPITAIVEQGKRASKGEPIATYQNASYNDYQNQIADIDKQIQTLVKDLPSIYSADLSNINAKILKYSNEVQNTTSYLKMQEYKTKLDELAYRKITILANSSPDSSAIRDLLSKREELVSLSKQSENVISTRVSGIVTYKVDGLENKFDYNKIESCSSDELDKLISAFDENTNSEFGIKIIDNFEAYFLVKTKSGDYDKYIKEGKKYKIRISDLENLSIYATLKRNINSDGYNYSIFILNNEIDHLIDYRKLSCEVVWNSISGMALPLNAIYTDEVDGYKYVLMVYGTEYKKIPINIIYQSDSIAIVDNVDKSVYQKYNLDNRFKLELYDELVIEEQNRSN